MVGLSADYFAQLTAEHAVTTFVNNRPRRRWVPKAIGARNEAWDCLVYALAARLSLPNKLTSVKPARRAPAAQPTPSAEPDGAAAEQIATETPADVPDEDAQPPPARPPKRRKGWGSYRQ